MNSFIKNLLTVFLFLTGFFVFFTNSNIAEAQTAGCQIESAGFRPSGILYEYDDDSPYIIYIDVDTSDCDASDLLKFSIYSIDIQDSILTERLIQDSFFMVDTNSSSNTPTATLSNAEDFSIPIRLGEEGNINDCVQAAGYTTFQNVPDFISPTIENLFGTLVYQSDPDCFLYLKIFKSSPGSNTAPELIYSVGAPNDPRVIYDCGVTCEAPFSIPIPSSNCFLQSDDNTNNGLLPYLEACDLQNSTISVTTTAGQNTGGVVSSEYSTTPLAPLPGFTGDPDVGQWLESLFTILIVIAGLLALIMIVVGGITYLTSESFGEKGKGKSYIVNAVTGLVLALGAWVILNTINPELAEDLNIKIPTVSIDGPTREWDDGNAAVGTNIAPKATLNGEPIVMGMPWPDDSQQRAQLSAAGISVVSSGNSNCTPTAGTPNCTSVYFDSNAESVIGQIISFKNTCNCEVIITGGSEAWLHSTHGPNKKIIDMRATESMNSYLNGLPGGPSPGVNFPSGKTVNIEGLGRFYAEPSGSTGNTTAKHWHITFN
jgi:hypothetical protein